MPANEIKEFRKAGNLDAAFDMARSELDAQPENIWAKRNISWVYYHYTKLNVASHNLKELFRWLEQINVLVLPADEVLFFEQIGWQVGKLIFQLSKSNPPDLSSGLKIFELVKSFHFPQKTPVYSFVFKAFHKLFKDTDNYVRFAEWWDFENFLPDDFLKETLPDGKSVMAIAEQAYIAYAKSLLPKKTFDGHISFDRQKVLEFVPKITLIVENYPDFQYPGYFLAKILLATGERENVLSRLLPFAKKKKNDFWVWQVLGEALSDDPEKSFACYCRGLLCKAPEEMKVGLRQRGAAEMIKRNYLTEAKTEIEKVLKTKTENGHSIPKEITVWQSEPWFLKSPANKDNFAFYNRFATQADELLFFDIPEELVIVENVNEEQQILNFIATEQKAGFFRFEKYLKRVDIGDVLRVRFEKGTHLGIFQIVTAEKISNDDFKAQYFKSVKGVVRIPEGKSFGFIENAFIHPNLIRKFNLQNGEIISASTMKTFNRDKNEWNWKVVEIRLK